MQDSKNSIAIQHKRPSKINDLDILWAIRDIPRHELSITKKGILSMFLACIGNRGTCHYNLDQLQEIMGIGQTGLRENLYWLEEKGYLKITRPAQYKRGAANEYSLNYELIISIAETYRWHK